MGNNNNKSYQTLTKNWTPHGNHTYRNNVTGQIIDSHTITARSQQQLNYHNHLLMKRAALNHPNVFKLLYFCQTGTDTLCSNATYKTQLYLEHAENTLESVVGRNEFDRQCLCCHIVNGIKYLLQRYGPFKVRASQVWLVGDKLRNRQVSKVWINSDPKLNVVEQQVSQQQMSKQVTSLLERLKCKKIREIENQKFNNIEQLFDFVYQKHQQVPIGHQTRKRINSQVNNKKQIKKLEDSVEVTASRQKVINKNSSKLHRFFSESSQLPPSPPTQFQFKKYSTPKSNSISKEDIFYRPQTNNKIGIKAEDIFYRPQTNNKIGIKAQETGFNKKVNFSYTNGLATPKYNKSYQQKSVYQSPQLLLQSKPLHHQSSETIKQPKMPVLVSRFSQQTDLHIQEMPNDLKLQQLVSTQRKRSQSFNIVPHTFKADNKKSEIQPQSQNKPVQIKQVIHQAINPKDHLDILPTFSPESSKKKQKTLKLEKNLQISYTSIEHKSEQLIVPEQKRDRFKIGSEYTIQVQPENSSNMSKTQIEINDSATQQRQQQLISSNKGNVDRLSPPSGLNFQQTAISEDGREQSIRQQSQNNQSSYLNYIKQVEQVKLSQSEIPKVKTISSERVRPSQIIAKKEIQKQMYLNGTMDRPQRQNYKYQIQKTNLHRVDTNPYKKRDSRKPSQELRSLYNQSCSSDDYSQKNKAFIMAKIQNAEQKIKDNKRKLEQLQLEQDLQRERGAIKHEVETLLSGRNDHKLIKEKVKHKQATFAQLKAEASKLLEDFNF